MHPEVTAGNLQVNDELFPDTIETLAEACAFAAVDQDEETYVRMASLTLVLSEKANKKLEQRLIDMNEGDEFILLKKLRHLSLRTRSEVVKANQEKFNHTFFETLNNILKFKTLLREIKNSKKQLEISEDYVVTKSDDNQLLSLYWEARTEAVARHNLKVNKMEMYLMFLPDLDRYMN